tara:strand:+ start:1992 stop:13553 length:11562 start_codon:yes stop_codon:yes gene_type:complete
MPKFESLYTTDLTREELESTPKAAASLSPTRQFSRPTPADPRILTGAEIPLTAEDRLGAESERLLKEFPDKNVSEETAFRAKEFLDTSEPREKLTTDQALLQYDILDASYGSYVANTRANNLPLFPNETRKLNAKRNQQFANLYTKDPADYLDEDQLKEYQSKKSLSTDPEGYHARAANRAYLEGVNGAPIADDKYDFARDQFARLNFGLEDDTSDKALFQAIKSRHDSHAQAGELVKKRGNELYQRGLEGATRKELESMSFQKHAENMGIPEEYLGLSGVQLESAFRQGQADRRDAMPIVKGIVQGFALRRGRDINQDQSTTWGEEVYTSVGQAVDALADYNEDKRGRVLHLVSQELARLPEIPDDNSLTERSLLEAIQGATGLRDGIGRWLDMLLQHDGIDAGERGGLEGIGIDGGVGGTEEDKKKRDVRIQLGQALSGQLSSIEMWNPTPGFFDNPGEKLVLGGSRQIPNMVTVFAGLPGLTALGTSMAGDSYGQQRLDSPDGDKGKQALLGTLSGGLQAATEVFLTKAGFKLMRGKVPGLATLFAKAGIKNPALRSAIAFPLGAVGASAVEYTEEVVQEATDNILTDIARELSELDSDTDWGEFITSWTTRNRKTEEVLYSIVPFAFLGAGAVTSFRHFQHGEFLQNATPIMKGLGFKNNVIQEIQKASPTEAAKLVQGEVKRVGERSKAEDASKPASALAEEGRQRAAVLESVREAANLARFINYGLLTEEENEFTGEDQWVLRLPDQAEQIFETEEAAVEAHQSWAIDQHQDNLELITNAGILNTIEFLTEEGQLAYGTRVVGKDVDMTQERAISQGLATMKAMKARANIFALQEGTNGNPVDLQIMARRFAHVSTRGVYRGTVEYYRKADGLALFEDLAETNWHKAITLGFYDGNELLQHLREVQQLTKQKYVSDDYQYSEDEMLGLLEGLSKLSVEYALGHVNAESFPAKLKRWLEYMVAFAGGAFRHAITLARSKNLMDKIKEGKIDEKFLSQVADSVGLNDAETTHRREQLQAAEAQAQALGDFEEISSSLRGRIPHPQTLLENSDPMHGEVARIHDSMKKITRRKNKKGQGTVNSMMADNYFLPQGDHVNLDEVRRSLNEDGYNFETPAEMIEALEDSLLYGIQTHATGNFEDAGSNSSFSVGNTTVTPNAQTKTYPTKDGGVVGPASFSITAHHGTPHKVSKFSTEKIGAGIGAQLHGHGLYMASDVGVASTYARQRSKHKGFSGKGNLYTVNLKIDQDELLDWDKPLIEQSATIRKILSERMDGTDVFIGPHHKAISNPTGKDIYENVIKGEDAKKTSETLHSMGIKGVRYFDSSSQWNKGSSNYVVFNDADIKITEVNGESSFSMAGVAPSIASFVEPGFYSQLENVIELKMGKSASVDQILGMINPAKGSGIKADEIKWSGLEEALPGLAENGKVSKDKLLTYLRENGRIQFRTLQSSKFSNFGRPDNNSFLQRYQDYQLEGGTNYLETVLALPSPRMDERVPSRENTYTSPHFSMIPNYVAHMRTNEREDSNGQPGLFIEEIQSDRHQEGRKKGYVGDEQTASEEQGSVSSVDLNTYKPAPIADAPYRKEWPLAMFKRALRAAVSTGKEWIGWTSGDIQNDRYNLGYKIDNITYSEEQVSDITPSLTPLEPVPQTVYHVVVKDSKGSTLYADKHVPPSMLEQMLGKDLAQKIVKGAGENVEPKFDGTIKEGFYNMLETKSLSGLNLQVGGEGMEGFYDKMLPTTVQKYVKKWGGKVTQQDLSEDWVVTRNGREMYFNTEEQAQEFLESRVDNFPGTYSQPFKIEAKAIPIWHMEITEEMRNSVNAGQSSFSVTRAQDAEYMAAVEAGDVETQQNLVDAAAKAAGYVSQKVYHGTWQNDIITNRKGRSEKAKPFNVFKTAKRGSTNNVLNRLGFFFTPNQQIAEQYTYTAGGRKVGGEPRVISAYLSGKFKEVPFAEASQMNQWRFDRSKYKTKKAAVAAAEKLKADAIAEGFDGLHLMFERGGTTEPVEIIAFSPNQIKSADPVTRDDAGNVIPLSQRFDESSDQISFSVAPAQDAEYLAAVESGDVETQQKMVDEAAKKAGYVSPKVYHGSNTGNIMAFEQGRAQGIYFTENRQYAGGYGTNEYSAYLKTGKIADLRRGDSPAFKKMVNLFNESGGWSQNVDAMESRDSPDFNPATDFTWEIFDNPDTDVWFDLSKDGYDSVILEEDTGIDSYVVFDPNQIKSADPVTRDDAGNVIPLSQRFDETSDQSSFSVSQSKTGMKPPKGVTSKKTDALPIWNIAKQKDSLPKVLTTEKQRETFFARLDSALEWLREDPSKIGTAGGWVKFLRKAGVYGDVTMPPTGISELFKDPAGYAAKVRGAYHGDLTIEGTNESAKKGLDGTSEMRDLIGEGNAPAPWAVALHHLWGILSRMLPPIDQEGMWLRLIAHRPVLDAIQSSIDGKFKLSLEQWQQLVQDARAASADAAGKIGNNATANANAFYLMLKRLNGRWQDAADVYAAKDSREMGRQFWSLDAGALGIKNKVQRFIGLTFGVPGVIMDRWKFVELWLPTAVKGTDSESSNDYFKYSKSTPESPLPIYGVYGDLDANNLVASTALYEGLEVAMQEAINRSPELQELLGDHQNPGGLHWYGWNAIKNEAVGHSSLELTKDLIKNYGLDFGVDAVVKQINEGEYFTEGTIGSSENAKVFLRKGKIEVSRERISSGLQSGPSRVHGRGARKGTGESRQGVSSFSLAPTPQDAGSFSLSSPGVERLEAAVIAKLDKGPEERIDFALRLIDRLHGLRKKTILAPSNDDAERIKENLREAAAIFTALPVEARPKASFPIGAIADAKTEKAKLTLFEKMIDSADKALEVYLQKQYLESLTKLFDLAKPDLRQNKGLRTRLSPNAQRLATAAFNISVMSPSAVMVELQSINTAIDNYTRLRDEAADNGDDAAVKENSDLLHEAERYHRMLDTFGALPFQSASELAHALDNLRHIYVQGKFERGIIDDQKRQDLNGMRESLLPDLGGRPASDEWQRNTANEGFGARMKAFAMGSMSFHQIMEKFFPTSQAARDFQARIRTADRDVTRARINARERFEKHLRQRWGKGKIGQSKILAELSERVELPIKVRAWKTTEDEDPTPEQAKAILDGDMTMSWSDDPIALQSLRQALADFNLKRLRDQSRAEKVRFKRVKSRAAATPLVISPLETVYILQLAGQEQYLPALDRYGYTEGVIDALRAGLSSEARDVADFLAVEYAGEYDRLNPVHRDLFHMDMPRVRNYAPGSFEHAMHTSTPDPDGTEAAQVNALSAGFFKAREHHTARPQQRNALDVFWGHHEQTEYFIAWAQVSRDMGIVFKTPDVRRALESKYGRKVATNFFTWLDGLATDFRNPTNEEQAMKEYTANAQASLSAIGLAVNVGSLLKQVSAGTGAMLEMPTNQAVAGMYKAITNPSSFKHLWETDTIQQRIKQGMSPEDRALLDASNASPSTIMALLEAGRAPLGLVDGIFTTISAMIAYNYHLAEAKKAGLSPEKAEAHALEVMDRVIVRTAQPATAQDKSLIENTSKGFTKFLLIFRSDPRQKMALAMEAVDQFSTGQISALELGRRFFWGWAVYGILAQIATDLWHAISREEDEELSLDDYIYAAIAGPITGLPLFGGIIDTGIRNAINAVGGDLQIFANSTNPLDKAAFDMFKFRTLRKLTDDTDDTAGEMMKAILSDSRAWAQVLGVFAKATAIVPVTARAARDAYGMIENALPDSPEVEQGQILDKFLEESKEASDEASDRKEILLEELQEMDESAQKDRLQELDKTLARSLEKSLSDKKLTKNEKKLRKIPTKERHKAIQAILKTLAPADRGAYLQRLREVKILTGKIERMMQ